MKRVAAVRFPGYGLQARVLQRDHAHSLNIWELELDGAAAPRREKKKARIPGPIPQAQTDQGHWGLQISTGRKEIGVHVDRSGTMEIWVASRDGESNPRCNLTAVGPEQEAAALVARQQWIVFLTRQTEMAQRFTKIKLGSGAPQAMTPDESENRMPEAGREHGKWIYFASSANQRIARSGKVASRGGRRGNSSDKSTADHACAQSPPIGKTLYYAKPHTPIRRSGKGRSTGHGNTRAQQLRH